MQRLKISLVVREGPSGSFSKIVRFPFGGDLHLLREEVIALWGRGHYPSGSVLPFWECPRSGHHSLGIVIGLSYAPRRTTSAARWGKFTTLPDPDRNQLIRDKAMCFREFQENRAPLSHYYCLANPTQLKSNTTGVTTNIASHWIETKEL